jgi:hypothetical protein
LLFNGYFQNNIPSQTFFSLLQYLRHTQEWYQVINLVVYVYTDHLHEFSTLLILALKSLSLILALKSIHLTLKCKKAVNASATTTIIH